MKKYFLKLFRTNRYLRKIKSMLTIVGKINQSSPQFIHELIQGSNVATIIFVGEVIDLYRVTETRCGKLLQSEILTKLSVK